MINVAIIRLFILSNFVMTERRTAKDVILIAKPMPLDGPVLFQVTIKPLVVLFVAIQFKQVTRLVMMAKLDVAKTV